MSRAKLCGSACDACGYMCDMCDMCDMVTPLHGRACLRASVPRVRPWLRGELAVRRPRFSLALLCGTTAHGSTAFRGALHSTDPH